MAYTPNGVANIKKRMDITAIVVVIAPSLLDRNHPDNPMLTMRLRNPIAYPINMLAQSTVIIPVSTLIGNSGWSNMISLHAATTAIKRLHAANAEDETIQLTDFFSDVNTTMVTKIVADIPPKKALTKESCSATATM